MIPHPHSNAWEMGLFSLDFWYILVKTKDSHDQKHLNFPR